MEHFVYETMQERLVACSDISKRYSKWGAFIGPLGVAPLGIIGGVWCDIPPYNDDCLIRAISVASTTCTK